jgi:hypothetical protein
MRDVGQQSLFDCQRTLVITIDQVSKLQSSARLRIQLTTLRLDPHTAITNQQFSGGGEGIRTPDPRVANAVLCQLSYTPDKGLVAGAGFEPATFGL